MKETSQAIATELATLEARRESLSTDTEAARLKLSEAREGLITGAAKVASVTAAQSTFTALAESLDELDERIAERRDVLDATRAAELKEANSLRHAELGQKRTELQKVYDATRETADAQLAEVAALMLDLRRRDAEARREMEAIYPSVATFTDRGLQDRTLRFGGAIAQAVQIVTNEADRERIKSASRQATARREQQEREQRQRVA
jgi:hypothetical protein